MVEVTQADIDAVDEIFIQSIRQPERNDDWLLSILARHRIAAEQRGKLEGYAQAVADVVKWLVEMFDDDNSIDGMIWRNELSNEITDRFGKDRR